jgi:hypothetical protein
MWLGWRRHGKTSWKHLLGMLRRIWEINSKMHLGRMIVRKGDK